MCESKRCSLTKYPQNPSHRPPLAAASPTHLSGLTHLQELLSGGAYLLLISKSHNAYKPHLFINPLSLLLYIMLTFIEPLNESVRTDLAIYLQ